MGSQLRLSHRGSKPKTSDPRPETTLDEDQRVRILSQMSEAKVALNNPGQAGGTREQDLILSVQRGQHELFCELVRVPTNGGCGAAALAILRNEHDAEDAAQEAMLKALANIRQFCAPRPASAPGLSRSR